MNSSITFKKIWQDDDMVELTITVTDGTSLFQCNTYVGHQTLTETAENLNVFKDHVYGGLHDLRFGEFGPEYASGAFHARFEFHRSVTESYRSQQRQSQSGMILLIQRLPVIRLCTSKLNLHYSIIGLMH